MRIYCLFQSGRMIEQTHLGEARVRQFAQEFPTINYFFSEEKVEW